MKRSLGEVKVAQILRAEGLKFEIEKTFPDLKKGHYRYDFYIPSTETLIEYDGEGHFVENKKFHKRHTDFSKSKERDRQKNSYALAHKYKLYRIPFWELENIKTLKDILSPKFLVTSIFHNDEVWRQHKILNSSN